MDISIKTIKEICLIDYENILVYKCLDKKRQKRIESHFLCSKQWNYPLKTFFITIVIYNKTSKVCGS